MQENKPLESNTNEQSEITEEQMAHGLNTDDSINGQQHLDDQLTDENPLERELEEAKDKHLRLAAEFENFRRRTIREKQELHQTAGRDVIESLLDILDDSNRASATLESTQDTAAWKEGVNLVFNKFRNALQQKGLTEMECKGEDFDPELHEAITEIPASGPDMIGKVIDVVQPGYYLNDKLIRHAKVVVGK